MGGSATCQKCNQPVLWFTTRERGTPVAVDPSPDPDEGTVMITAVSEPTETHLPARSTGGRRRRKEKTVFVDVLTGDALTAAIADKEKLFMLHSKTCPAGKPFNPRPAHVRLHLPPKPKGPR
ncbi:hypothetical protein SAMN05444374_11658 [Rhodococcoides kroppenstedtii]|uniref:Uncharacterized protein n=1 Tax=Rhodococcoides kroppenstedtii TaxID=293050 RepID=A0A1I0U9X9_9NOCA|nr:hypothetical protein [Rhodococcus kroppenstedtii]SFA60899.1 hypothetical protein SAMN05444374_11658 [Rhodococcus kroppenstedtii]